jgi:ubiquitin carboxyl-terminal hydrolase L3
MASPSNIISSSDNIPKPQTAAQQFVPLGTPLHISILPILKKQLTPLPPLENNPEVLTTLIHTLGLSSSLAFHDVWSLDDPSLLNFIPRPVLALLLVFPVSASYESLRVEEDKALPQYEGHGPEEEVVWFRQTIRNACGMMGLLHLASNGGAREFIGMPPPPNPHHPEGAPIAKH